MNERDRGKLSGIKEIFARKITKQDWRSTDFSRIIIPSEVCITPFQPIEQANGFVVGGKNPTDVIRRLDCIGLQTIEELEERMRPGKDSEMGFLGKDESLQAVLAEDNEYIHAQGVSHQQIGREVRMFSKLFYQGIENFTLNQRRFNLDGLMTMGVQKSPFNDWVAEGADMMIINVDAKTGLSTPCLLGYLIERYGFYEGKGA